MSIARWRIALVITSLVALAAVGAGLVQATRTPGTTTTTATAVVPSADASSLGAGVADEVALAALTEEFETEAAPTTGDVAKGRAHHPATPHRLFHGLHHRLRQVVHGEITLDLPKKGLVTVAIDRGAVSAAASGSVSLKEKNGQTVTVTTTSETRLRKDGKNQPLSELKVGDEVLAFSVKTAGAETFTARRLIVPQPQKDAGSDSDSDTNG